MPKYRPYRRSRNLVQQALDESISQNDHAELEQLLQSDPSLRSYYLQEAGIHASLHRWANRTNAQHAETTHDRKIIALPSASPQKQFFIPAAVALILLSLIAGALYYTNVDSEAPNIVELQKAPNTQLFIDNSQTDTPEMQQLTTGSQLKLTRGSIELNFTSGVRSIVTAPAQLTISSEAEVLLQNGRSWFHVPENAIGFTVKTSELNVVDLGTDFSVLAYSGKGDEVHVAQGKVSANSLLNSNLPHLLTTKQAMTVADDGTLEEIPFRQTQSSLPNTKEYLYWDFDSVENSSFTAKGNASEMADADIKALASSSIGKFGSAATLSATAQPTHFEGFDLSEPTTFSFWFKANQTNTHRNAQLFSWAIPQTDSRFKRAAFHLVPAGSDELQLRISCSGYQQVSTNLNDDRWHHISVVFHGSHNDAFLPDIDVYIDGEKDNFSIQQPDAHYYITDVPGRHTYTSHPFTLGVPEVEQHNYLDPPTQEAQLDELYIIREALNPDAIRMVMTENQLP